MKTQEPVENAELFNHPLSRDVIGCAIEVHRHLGPGLLESAYEKSLAYEFRLSNIDFEIQKPMPVRYKGVHLSCGYRLDFLVDNFLILELKSVERIQPIHQAQLLTYMRLAEAPLGLIINFNVKLLSQGIKKCAITKFA